MTLHDKPLDELCIDTLRFLAVDAVEAAKSGHPGLPLGAAPMAYVIWDRFLKFNPRNPRWPDRDRFILSAGHGSALLYSLLHLYGYDLALDEVKRFRQWESKTPGHPEYGLTPGVEATTGPLGQGFAMGVGMAIAEQYLAGLYNRPGHTVVDHYTYAIVSDGDLMEGISSESASLAGHLGLGKLIYLYDQNDISIEGSTDLAFTEDVRRRFDAFGWHTVQVDDGNDLAAITRAVESARADSERPSLILVRTHIGFGSPKQDSAAAHGEPLGAEATRATKEKLGWPLEPAFHVPAAASRHCGRKVEAGQRHEAEWQQQFAAYRREHAAEATRFEETMAGRLPVGWSGAIPTFKPGDKLATRDASGKVMNALAESLPQLVGGAGDLAPSTKTLLDKFPDVGRGQVGGRNLRFGVREHAMGAAVNGMALHGGLLPYGSTFLIFSDYMRPAIRLAALMNVHSLFVFSHDSIGLGEDGPTHQPIEHLASLRAIPNLTVLRPADGNETAAAWRVALELPGPACLITTRQKLPVLDAEIQKVMAGVARGAYVLKDCPGGPELVLIATGSEVSLALAAEEQLLAEGIRARLVSMPSWELFAAQDQTYRDEVLPPAVPHRLAIEAATPLGWCRWVGSAGTVIGIETFGASAPGEVVMSEYGFNVENVVRRARGLLGR